MRIYSTSERFDSHIRDMYVGLSEFHLDEFNFMSLPKPVFQTSQINRLRQYLLFLCSLGQFSQFQMLSSNFTMKMF